MNTVISSCAFIRQNNVILKAMDGGAVEKSALIMSSIARLQCNGLTVNKLMELLNVIAPRVGFFLTWVTVCSVKGTSSP